MKKKGALDPRPFPGPRCYFIDRLQAGSSATKYIAGNPVAEPMLSAAASPIQAKMRKTDPCEHFAGTAKGMCGLTPYPTLKFSIRACPKPEKPRTIRMIGVCHRPLLRRLIVGARILGRQVGPGRLATDRRPCRYRARRDY
jgi:hypothetical protein